MPPNCSVTKEECRQSKKVEKHCSRESQISNESKPKKVNNKVFLRSLIFEHNQVQIQVRVRSQFG